MSKSCVSCGAPMEDDEKFCAECGARQPENTFSPQQATQYPQSAPQPTSQYSQSADGIEENKHLNFFVDPDEKLVGYLGRGFLQHYLTSGSLGKGFAAISDKRFYVKGKTYRSTGTGKYVKNTESKIVDLTDVTGTGIETMKNVGVMVLGILLLLSTIGLLIYGFANMQNYDHNPRIIGFLGGGLTFIPAVIALIMARPTMLLKVDFAGSSIAFDAKWYVKSECDEFQRKIRIAKDTAVRNAEARSARAISQAIQSSSGGATAANSVSTADELMKYASMRDKGLITDEEFQQFKAKLLNR